MTLLLTTPSENTYNWLNTRITIFDNPNNAIEAMIKTIKFEIKYFKVLRLDDYVTDLIESTEGKINVKQVLDAINNVIQNSKKSVLYTQLTGLYRETIKYAFDNKLLNIFDLRVESCIVAINSQAYLDDFIKAEKAAEVMKSKNKELAMQDSIVVIGLILNSQRLEVKKNLCVQMKLGLAFIGQLIQHLDKFENETSQKIREYLIERLQRYKEYAQILNNSGINAIHKIKPAIIETLIQKLSQEENVKNLSKLKIK